MSVINTPSMNRAERRRPHTREQLKAAALELLFEEGYADLTIKAITERADLGYGTFYLYFAEKDDYADANRQAFVAMLGSKGSNILAARYQNWRAEIHENNLREGKYSAALDLPPDFLAQFVAGALMRLLVWWTETENNCTPEDMANMLYQTIYRQKPPK